MIRVFAAYVFCPVSIATLSIATISIATVSGQTQRVDNYAPRTVLPVPVRAITNPKIISASETAIGDNELVIGVEIEGQSRAYPINQLTGPNREIINDQLAGIPIAATW